MNKVIHVLLTNADEATFVNGICVSALEATDKAPSGYTPLVIARSIAAALGCTLTQVNLQTPNDPEWNWDDIVKLIPLDTKEQPVMQELPAAVYLSGVESQNLGGGSWVDLLHCKDGRVVLLNDEAIAVYASKSAFEASVGQDLAQNAMWITKSSEGERGGDDQDAPTKLNVSVAAESMETGTLGAAMQDYPLFADLEFDRRILEMQVTDGCAVDCLAVLKAGHQLAILCTESLPKILDVVESQINVFYFG